MELRLRLPGRRCAMILGSYLDHWDARVSVTVPYPIFTRNSSYGSAPVVSAMNRFDPSVVCRRLHGNKPDFNDFSGRCSREFPGAKRQRGKTNMLTLTCLNRGSPASPGWSVGIFRRISNQTCGDNISPLASWRERFTSASVFYASTEARSTIRGISHLRLARLSPRRRWQGLLREVGSRNG